VNVELFVRVTADGADDDRSRRRGIYRNACEVDEQPEMDEQPMAAGSILQLAPSRPRNAHPPEILSAWSSSPAKRTFDLVSVVLALPLFAPLLLLLGIAVRLTSAGPVLFRQQRVGRGGRLFTILKFRTMIHNPDAAYNAITTDGNQPFTCIGPLLRRWKLDELPQILNVLRGDMSLVGPRPKMPEHVIGDLCCRPGITGAATIAFAREETLLDQLPEHDLEAYYHKVVLPAKGRLDAEYMARATFFTDVKLVVNSFLRRWDESMARRLLNLVAENAGAAGNNAESKALPWKSGIPVRVATLSARVDARRSA